MNVSVCGTFINRISAWGPKQRQKKKRFCKPGKKKFRKYFFLSFSGRVNEVVEKSIVRDGALLVSKLCCTEI